MPTRIVRALSIGGSRPETDASSSDPVGTGFLRGRAGSLNRPEGLKSINTSYLPLSTERAKGGSADVDPALKNGIPSPMSYSQAQTQHPHAAPSSSSSTYHPRHLDLLVKPKGWKLGDKLILNARAFTLGAAHYTNCKDRDRDRDGGKDKDKDREREKVFVRDRERGERSLAKLLDRPHLLVAALLQLA